MMMYVDEETLFTYIGYAAGLATILTFSIQILKIIETKKVTNLSSYMYVIYNLGLICWFAYGVYIENWLIVIANLLTFLFTFAILLLILYYDAEDKIERDRRDDLTCVYNRKYFEEASLLKLVEDNTLKQPSAVISVSISNYGKIAENYGQKAANKLLKATAKFLDNDLRGNDMVARFEENEFVIYVSNANDKSAKAVATRLFKGSKNLKITLASKQEITPELLIGICSSKQAKDLKTMIAKANKLMRSITSKTKEKIKIEK
jgi:MtN3 and saliva related transmembrane protein